MSTGYIKKGKGLKSNALSKKSLFLNNFAITVSMIFAVMMVLTVIPSGGAGSALAGTAQQTEIIMGESPSATLASVDLGSASNFVILAKSGISTTGSTSITGNIGASPIDSTAITGFGLTMDSSNQFSTSSLITGKVYAADYTDPTPSILTTAVSDMETAYTDAAGRTIPDYTELGAGEIGGMTLSPGLYKWGTDLLITTDVTLSGNASDVWIFQVAQDLTVADGKQVILSGTASEDNIFWQVAGQVTIGTTATIYGNIICQTAIVLNTGAILNGRALAQTAVTCDANAVVVPTDVILPIVSSTDPINNATDVAVNSMVTATFNKIMDASTINGTTFIIVQGVTPVSGTVNYTVVTATFEPTTVLTASTEYTATITNEATDMTGNSLASNYTWNFTTGAAPDTIAPNVTLTVPANTATGVAVNSAMTATFSEAMDPLTITNVTFTLRHGATSVTGGVTYSGVTAVFRPTSDLAASTLYTATITTGVKDLAGNDLAVNYVWNFTTSAAPDTTAPTVTLTVPANTATGVAVNSAMTATFSEAMNPLTITTTTFTMKHGTTNVTGTVTYTGVTAVFTPTGSLAASTLYTATITTGAKDIAGNALATNKVWNFTTSAAPDTTAPTVTLTVPTNTATGVAVNSALSATFSEAMNPLTITTVTFTLKAGLASITGTVTYTGFIAVFTPASALAASTVYTATITTGAKDIAGNALATNKVWNFTTSAAPDTTAPTVTLTVPTNTATGVAINSAMTATFSEAMNPLTITTVTFTLKAGVTSITGTVTYTGVTAVFTPTGSLAASTLYTATITTGAKDIAGNALATNKVWNFTTSAAPDTTAPTVTLTVPTNTATSVAINSAMTATFSEAMNPLTITTVTFTLEQGATIVDGTVTYIGTTAVFTPENDLTASTVYTATITTGAKDIAGNALATNKVWNFTTSAAPDTTAPTVTLTVPANSTTEVAVDGTINVTFSEAMDPLTITTATFTLMQGATVIEGTVTYSGLIAVFTPTSALAASSVYSAKITTGVKDLAGNALATDKIWSFTTNATPDTTAPTVTLTVPANSTTEVAVDGTINVTFSEAMDPLTITTATFIVKQGTTVVEGTVTYSGTKAVFTPTDDLEGGKIYTVTVTTGAKDLAGNGLASNHTWSFTTLEESDSSGFPLWAIVLIVLVVAGAIGVVIYRMRKKPTNK